MTAAGKPGGIPAYAEQLAVALGRVAPASTLVLWCGSETSARAARRLAPPNARVVTPTRLVRYVAKWGQMGRLNPLTVESLVGPVEVFHGLNFFLPAQRGRVRLVATFHDLSALTHPEWHPWERVLTMRGALRRTASLVDHVITPTEAVRAEAMAVLGLSPEAVTAIPHGVSTAFRPRQAEELKPVLDRFGLRPGGYLCFTGAIEPRKNLGRLLDAIAAVGARRPDVPTLVLIGPPGWRNAEIRARLQSPRVRYLGYLAPTDMAVLVAGSLFFVYPSLYEGFGLPVLEALASGVPVLTSAGGALGEVAGDGAFLVDPVRTDAIAAAVAALRVYQRVSARIE